MIWRVEKNGHVLHLVGTAHFFPYSFRRQLTCLIRSVPAVMFEGPLDDESFKFIAEYARQGRNVPSFLDALTPEAVKTIDCILRSRVGGQAGDSWLMSVVDSNPVYFESFTRGVRPWEAFFSIWRTCIGWEHSVDMEAYRIACKLGLQIHFLETLDEQLAVLDNIPMDHFARQLNDVSQWDAYKNDYVKTYLSGNLDNMMTLLSRYSPRRPGVLKLRDRNLFDRMMPVFEHQDALAFIGFPHVPGVTNLFRENGYVVTQVCI